MTRWHFFQGHSRKSGNKNGLIELHLKKLCGACLWNLLGKKDEGKAEMLWRHLQVQNSLRLLGFYALFTPLPSGSSGLHGSCSPEGRQRGLTAVTFPSDRSCGSLLDSVYQINLMHLTLLTSSIPFATLCSQGHLQDLPASPPPLALVDQSVSSQVQLLGHTLLTIPISPGKIRPKTIASTLTTTYSLTRNPWHLV